MNLKQRFFDDRILMHRQHDWLLWGSLSLLLTIGAVIFFSASVHISHSQGHPFSLAYKQWAILLISVILMLITQRIPIALYRRHRLFIGFMGIVSLTLVYIPGLGAERNFAQRWIQLPGLTYQTSEFAKLAYLIYLAGYIETHAEKLKTVWSWVLILVGLPTAIYIVLLILQPDFGSTVQIIFFSLTLTFLAGAHLGGFALLFALFALLLAIMLIFEPYRVLRIMQFLDPWQDPFGSGYNLTQSLMAIGRGGWDGVGLGNSIHKLGFLPEAHTDFIVSILAEELGAIGIGTVICLYSIVLWRIIALSLFSIRQQKLFSGLLALGIALWLFFQVFVNIAGASQLLPPKGLVLPFFSQGGSFILTYMIALGLIMRIEYEVRLSSPKQTDSELSDSTLSPISATTPTVRPKIRF